MGRWKRQVEWTNNYRHGNFVLELIINTLLDRSRGLFLAGAKETDFRL
jgi:hypothetical protein